MQKKKRKKWMKTRHKVITELARVVMTPYLRLKFGVKVEKFADQQNRPYLIVLNHQTVFDQFFVGMSFRGPIYYVATEDIFSNGWVSKLIKYVIAPIPIKKQTTDVQAVMNCARIAREGGTIAVAPEGNRTYSGRTAYIKPSIVKLVRALKLPLVIYRIEGGYGVQPRWTDVVRRGKMRAYVHQVVDPEEYKKMSDDELLALIQNGLNVDEACVSGTFYHKKNAEYLERVLYVCPKCGLSEFESHGDVVSCKKCGLTARYLPTKEFEGVGEELPFRFVADWYDYQCDFVNKMDYTAYVETPAYVDKADLWEVILYQRKNLLAKEIGISLYGDRIETTASDGTRQVYRFDDVSVITVLGRNKLNFYVGDRVFQLKGAKSFNALKYMNFYWRYKNTIGESEDGEF
ncbi:MAG: 1-acyl-sn-glycerol-3-phosphate acyltransferase, partial [Lachnospiraceae bacterium]|nr:1-acyl-sn-glycerol-3-phosphate acyltransferase [Lachnospiraceae bacterium]